VVSVEVTLSVGVVSLVDSRRLSMLEVFRQCKEIISFFLA